MTTEQEHNHVQPEDGDVHDADSGEYLFTLDEANGLPATLQILHGGFWYVYKIDGREKYVPEAEPLLAPDHEEPHIESTDPLKDL